MVAMVNAIKEPFDFPLPTDPLPYICIMDYISMMERIKAYKYEHGRSLPRSFRLSFGTNPKSRVVIVFFFKEVPSWA